MVLRCVVQLKQVCSPLGAHEANVLPSLSMEDHGDHGVTGTFNLLYVTNSL